MSSAMNEEIRPGVRRPDWSVVTRPAARAALKGRRDTRSNLSERWSRSLLPVEDLVWRTVVELFATAGRPPSTQDIAAATGITREQTVTILGELRARDLLVLDPSGTAITHAYPFSAGGTEHRIELFGRHVDAVCAIDALGIGGMLSTDTRIESSCRACGDQIEIVIGQNGMAVEDQRPSGIVVWYDLAYEETAAASCCPAIAFFCSDEHLQQWLNNQSPARVGWRLGLEEGLEVGRALFEPVLRLESAPPVS